MLLLRLKLIQPTQFLLLLNLYIILLVSTLTSYTKQILKYLDRTIDYSIIYSRLEYLEESSPIPIGYIDINYSSNKYTSKSISSNIFILYSRLVLQTSKRQKIVVLSTTKIEYITLYLIVYKVIQIYLILTKLGIVLKDNYLVLITYNSSRAITIGKANKFYKYTKYINIIYYYIRQEIIVGQIITPYI